MDEEIKTKKKQWQKPELVVLLRTKPQEGVLTNCKTSSTTYVPGNPNTPCDGGISYPTCRLNFNIGS
jgi:hypothetical protein